MSGLVNYSSEEEQDDYPHLKAGEQRERIGRNPLADGKKLKHRRRCSSSSDTGSDSDNKNVTPPPSRKERGGGGNGSLGSSGSSSNRNERGSGTTNNSSSSSTFHHDEDKYKSSADRRADKYSRDHSRDRRDNNNRETSKHSRESRGGYREHRDDKSYDNGNNWHDKKYDDGKRHSKDHKRDNDYHRSEKRSRYDDKKLQASGYSKDRSSNLSKSRYNDRKPCDERKEERREDKRANDDRRNHSGSSSAHRRSGNDYNNERKDYRSSDDRSTPRSSAMERPNSYYRSNSKYSLDRRGLDEERKSQPQHSRSEESPDKCQERNSSSQREHPAEAINTTTTTIITRPEEPNNKSSSPAEVVAKKVLPTARNFEALLSLPLSETAPKQPNVVTVPPITEAGEAEALTVQLPSYYNPKVINPNKYAQQIQKRKLIWGAKKAEDSASKWGHAQFSQDSDGKVASKFMRLMGIKNVPPPTESANPAETAGPSGDQKKSDAAANPDFKSREAMFSTMEQQYEVARQVTHTMRGVGLGFSTQRPY
ncbi:arginine/serine-rich coiled-coil protein 2 [Stomoxys calcitrans]|uniref:arginine/serine-rich coiled-coil protein 2 n=1 Tax=Stomoxys calcitrans TaxID=35570 RepID=UPI0027E310E1|nr:arginine/serine-rich coiled-coil protein 2 [Stomoxys calcitrans]